MGLFPPQQINGVQAVGIGTPGFYFYAQLAPAVSTALGIPTPAWLGFAPSGTSTECYINTLTTEPYFDFASFSSGISGTIPSTQLTDEPSQGGANDVLTVSGTYDCPCQETGDPCVEDSDCCSSLSCGTSDTCG
jgi:hypothetical protein